MSTNGLALDDGNYKLKASTTGTGSESASTPCSAAIEALLEIKKHNRLRSDLDAYLKEVADYGLGLSRRTKMPNKEDFGLS